MRISRDSRRDSRIFFEILQDLSKIVDLVKIYYNLYEISASVGPLASVDYQLFSFYTIIAKECELQLLHIRSTFQLPFSNVFNREIARHYSAMFLSYIPII